MSYTVVAPYVTVKVRDVTGKWNLHGFYAGAPLPADCDQDDLDRLTRKGMLAKAEPAPEPEPAKPAKAAKPAAS